RCQLFPVARRISLPPAQTSQSATGKQCLLPLGVLPYRSQGDNCASSCTPHFFPPGWSLGCSHLEPVGFRDFRGSLSRSAHSAAHPPENLAGFAPGFLRTVCEHFANVIQVLLEVGSTGPRLRKAAPVMLK